LPRRAALAAQVCLVQLTAQLRLAQVAEVQVEVNPHHREQADQVAEELVLRAVRELAE
jgi:gamma-glutamyl-gamma-aminobutyrate hydrolase PuuD